jgi:zinc protease
VYGSEAQLNRVISYALFGLPQDYLFKYRDGLSSSTASDVLQAANRHLHLDRQQVHQTLKKPKP